MKLIKVFSSGNEIWQIMKKIEQSNKMNIKQKNLLDVNNFGVLLKLLN